ncbi:tryptophan halogenase family protein [Rheinheimera sp.]|uniref:tryptophan halogenase family protein n=1 Tax=Rheinheimera sp. TaxID=1869214 RepID=UPI002732CACA|nr:tryptophan halogenase family protein [Rheinheimera sp.]MDP2714593.1 tryptophan 7-halogenase [Rheinheimera sp.]
MQTEAIRSVLVVGGGTAGWLTAANLAQSFNSGAAGAVSVTLIESPDIPTIGVGEGTWPTMRATLQKLGIKEDDFLRSCNATFKQGTKFINWQHSELPGSYHHLFTSVSDPTQFNLAPYWLQGRAGDNLSYASAVSAQGVIAELGLAPKKITNKPYEGVLNYAYHLDAGKFAELLKNHAQQKLGVQFISANVLDVTLAADGSIAAVVTDTAGTQQADFYVDCTGFQSLLLGKAMGVGFRSVADTLLADHAVTIQVPHPATDTPLNACTHSTAQAAGWIWDIGLTNRRGVGYVYSSNHVSHDEAEQTLRRYIGPAAESLNARKLAMQVGYREKFWHKNCAAVGLSAAFVEPLEASAIFLIEAAANMLADQLPALKQNLPLAERKFNSSFLFRWQKTIDFIKLHYALSGRTEPFWQAARAKSLIPESLQDLMQSWQTQPVSAYDFAHVYEPFPMESYQYVLYGMGFKQQLADPQRYRQAEKAGMYFQRVQQLTRQLQQELPPQRELLAKIYQYGFSAL